MEFLSKQEWVMEFSMYTVIHVHACVFLIEINNTKLAGKQDS